MIIDHFRPSDPSVTVSYLLRLDGPKKRDTAQPRILELHDLFSPETAAAELAARMSKTRRKSDLIHLFIRCERSMSDAEMLQAVDRVLSELELTERPYMAVVHDEDGHLHVLSAVADERGDAPPRMGFSKSLRRAVTREEQKHLPRGDVGSRPWDSFLTLRLMRVARSIEAEWGLRRLNVRKSTERNEVSARAKALASEYGAEPLAVRQGAAISTAIRSARSWPALATKLARNDVGIELVIHPQSGKRGLRFLDATNPALACAASDLGRGLPALERKWGTFEYGFDGQTLVLPRSSDPTYAAAYDLYVDELGAIRQSKAASASTFRRQRAEADDRRAAASILSMHGVSGPTIRKLLKAAKPDIDTVDAIISPKALPTRIRSFAQFVGELALKEARFRPLAEHLKLDSSRLVWELIQTRKQSRAASAPAVPAPSLQQGAPGPLLHDERAMPVLVPVPVPKISLGREAPEAVIQAIVEAKPAPSIAAAPLAPVRTSAPTLAPAGASAVKPGQRRGEASVQPFNKPPLVDLTPQEFERRPATIPPPATPKRPDSDRARAVERSCHEAQREEEARERKKAEDNLRLQYELKAKRNDAWARTPWGHS